MSPLCAQKLARLQTIVAERVTWADQLAQVKRLHGWLLEVEHLLDPSQTCSRCGYQARNNRRSQSLFPCRSCGYQLNADYNASLNIREKHLVSLANLGISSTGGSSSSGLSRPPSGELQAPTL